jgi:LysR family hydrogen peroxide-inducible transcriptional activator
MLVLPTIRQLKYFISLAETLSFSKAAEDCFVTQSTLSASIKDLEKTLQQTLFERNSRQVLLTAEGDVLLKRARLIIEDMQALVHAVSRKGTPLSGTLRLGVIPTIAPYILPFLMQELNISYPNLELNVEENLTHSLLDKLEHGQIDLALLAFPCNCSHFEKLILGYDNLQLAINAKSTLKETHINITDIDASHLLLLEDGHCLKDHILESCQLDAKKTNKRLKASSLDTLLRLVQKGLGTTLIPEMAVKSGFYNDKDLQFIPFSGRIPNREIGLVWRKSSIQQDDFMLLGKLIKEKLAQTV